MRRHAFVFLRNNSDGVSAFRVIVAEIGEKDHFRTETNYGQTGGLANRLDTVPVFCAGVYQV